jgi:hypothetical protein
LKEIKLKNKIKTNETIVLTEQIIKTIISVFSQNLIIYHKINYLEFVYETFNEEFIVNIKICKTIFDYSVVYEDSFIINFLYTIGLLSNCIEYMDIVLNKDSLKIMKQIYEKIGNQCWKYTHISNCESEDMLKYLLINGYVFKREEYEIPLKYKFVNNFQTLSYLLDYLLEHNIKVNKNSFYSNIENYKCLELLLNKKIITNINLQAQYIYKNGLQLRIKIEYKTMEIQEQNIFKKEYPNLYENFIVSHNIQQRTFN